MIKRKTVIAGAVAGTLFVGVSRAPAIIVGMVPIDDQGNVELDAQGNVIINDATFLNDFVGATRFYDAGFFGQTSTVANIEGGWVWNGHDVFVNRAVDQYIIDPANPLASGPPPYVDHATGVGNVLAGLGPLYFFSNGIGFSTINFGMAPEARLWSGAVATSLGTHGSFDIATNSAFIYPYRTAMITGIGGKTADVINSSWGESSDAPPAAGNTVQPGSNGNDYFSIAIDAMVAQSGKTMVFSAGNSGPFAQVAGPASGFNSIVVGALGSVTDPIPYNTPSTFSSSAANDMFIPTLADGSAGINIPGVRTVVSLAAPGQDFIVAAYTGDTTQTGFYALNAAGTSYSAPTVAGGATLVVDAGKTLFPNNPKAIDGRVVKAVLMNSADKTQGWDNGQHLVGNIIETTQSLDFATGAGRMDLNQAFDQYTAGTTDLPGLGGGTVAPLGWDYGRVSLGAPDNYLIDLPLAGGSTFTATLDWFAIDLLDANSPDLDVTYGKFDNLYLQVWSSLNGLPVSLVAQSNSLYNSTEHLNFTLPSDGMYLIQVVWDGSIYNLLPAGNIDNIAADDFGLAWSATAIPEPASGSLLVIAGGFVCCRRRRAK